MLVEQSMDATSYLMIERRGVLSVSLFHSVLSWHILAGCGCMKDLQENVEQPNILTYSIGHILMELHSVDLWQGKL